MRHLKVFEDYGKQIWDSQDARPIIAEIYDIVDEVSLGSFGEGPLMDFLVTIDEFANYAKKYNGSFAANYFDSIDDLLHMLEFDIDGISPIVYVAPFWMSRSYEDIVKFGDVYSDTIYIKLMSEPNRKEIKKIRKKLEADECDVMEGASGNLYLRVWWD